MPTTYEITFIGSPGPAAAQAFTGLKVDVGPAVTVVSGDLDRRGLQALLNRMRAMGLELVAIRREAGPSGASTQAVRSRT